MIVMSLPYVIVLQREKVPLRAYNYFCSATTHNSLNIFFCCLIGISHSFATLMLSLRERKPFYTAKRAV